MSEWTLSRLEVPSAIALRARILDAYGQHQFILNEFASQTKQILWHNDFRSSCGLTFTILSDFPLRLNREFTAMTLRSKRFPYEAVSRIRRFQFSVLLPCEVQRMYQSKRGPIPLEEQPEWFLKKCAGWGFSAESLYVRSLRPASFIQRKKGQPSRRIILTNSEFSGILSVDDRETFLKSVLFGIGRHKAFGYGLLRLSSI